MRSVALDSRVSLGGACVDTKVEVGGASTSEGQPTALATSARRLPLLQAEG